jgi:histone demethylase JARID1
MTTAEEVNTQRFYLRKIEGAEILLAWETNFFRQELHRWAPVAPEAPPVLEYSLSTRKPRPTKQQKIMATMGINDPEQLPQHFRTKSGSFSSKRKSSEPNVRHQLAPLQSALAQSTSPGSPSQITPGTTRSITAPTFAQDGQLPFVFDNSYSVSSSQHITPSFGENTFLPTNPALGSPGFSQSPRPAGLDAALFNGPSFDRGDPDGTTISGLDANQYGSSQGAMDSIFADLTNHEEPEGEALANEHANDALAITGDTATGDNDDGEDTLFQD